MLVVVLIIGILAAIALPQYQKTVLKVRAAALRPQVDGFVKAQRIYFLENGSFTTDTSALSIDTETDDQHWYCGGSSDSRIHCNTDHINGLIFWEVWLESTGLQEIQCVAKTENAAAMSICQVDAIAKVLVNGDWTYFTVYTN